MNPLAATSPRHRWRLMTQTLVLGQIGNSGTPQDGGFYMIFQASNVSTTMATFQVEFFDSKGHWCMNRRKRAR